MLDAAVVLVGAQSVQEVEWQAGGILHEVSFAVHINFIMRPGVGFCVQAIQTGRDDNGLQQIWIDGAIGRRSSKRPGAGTRTMWVRLLPVQVTVLGAHVAPEACAAH